MECCEIVGTPEHAGDEWRVWTKAKRVSVFACVAREASASDRGGSCVLVCFQCLPLLHNRHYRVATWRERDSAPRRDQTILKRWSKHFRELDGNIFECEEAIRVIALYEIKTTQRKENMTKIIIIKNWSVIEMKTTFLIDDHNQNAGGKVSATALASYASLPKLTLVLEINERYLLHHGKFHSVQDFPYT